MLKDIAVYENIKRNEKCPCDSGKSFKQCCMSEYRESKKNKSNVIVSSYTPLKPLNDEDKEFFLKFYQELLVFSHQHKNDSDIVLIDDIDDDMSSFMSREREYFYDNVDKIIDSFMQKKNPTTLESELLKNIRDAKFTQFILMSYSEHSAVLMDLEQNYYNIKSLDSPFNEIFKHKSKYIGLRTAVIPYKNCYISDGVYNIFEIERKVALELDKQPYTQPIINYAKDKNFTILPLLIHFTLFSNIENFLEMEDIIQKKIPDTFAKGLLKLFNESYLQSKFIVPSFFRSTDLVQELNNEEGDRQFSVMIGGTPISNFEMGNTSEVIPSEVFAKYYQQKPLKDSASKSVYENIQKSKSPFFNGVAEISSFYTMIGMVNIDTEKIEEFEKFLKQFDKPKQRKELMIGVDSLFKELSEEFGFDMTAVFLGVGIDLDSIYYEIEKYRNTMKKNILTSIKEVKKYSIKK